MTMYVAICNSQFGMYCQGDTAELVQDCGYTLNVKRGGRLLTVLSENFVEVKEMKAVINGKTVLADTLEDLKDIARLQSSERWIYGRDKSGDFGFCNDPKYNCNKFMRYNFNQTENAE